MARPAPKTRLPAPAASLIGREREVAEVCELLRSDATRLVTLTGPGGVGKTRLGMEVARRIVDDFPDGACFVSLASVTDYRLLASTIGQGLGLREAGEKRVLERVAAYLQERKMLLWLDSFEQLLEASPVISELLTACSELTFLVASRAALRISGEHEFPVPPLALPDPSNLPADDTLLEYPAVALFAARASALDPDFVVDRTNAAAVAEICARVEGLPLALELAAGRLRLLSPEAMLARLERRLDLLTGGPRDLPARQQTLRGAIKWSYDLLDANEKRMFRILGAFAGSCRLEEVSGVCDRVGTFSGEVLDTVESLVDKSVVTRAGQDGEGRVTMLDTIREYALERLVKSGEANAIRRAHCLHYLALAEQAETELRGEEQGAFLDQLESEHDNLRAALSWSIEAGDAEPALRLGAAMWRFWYVRGHLSEGRRWLDAAIGLDSASAGRARARALTGAAVLAHYQGDYARAAALAEEALNLSRRLRDKQGVARSLDAAALVARSSGRYEESRDMCEKSLAIFRELGDSWHIGRSLAHLSVAARLEARYDEARVASEEAVTVLRELGDAEGTAYALNALGGAALAQGSHAQARSLQEEALALMRSAGDRRGVTRVLHAFGLIALREGDCATARALLERTVGLVSQFGDRSFMSISVDALAGVAMVEGKAEEAARLLGAADALREAVGVVLPPPAYRPEHEAVGAGCRSRLGDERFAALRAEGQGLSEDQIVSRWGREGRLEDVALVGAAEADSHPDELTSREVQVLRLVADGLTDVEVAERLVVSPRTVHSHLRSIYRKLDVKTRSAATRYAIEHSLV